MRKRWRLSLLWLVLLWISGGACGQAPGEGLPESILKEVLSPQKLPQGHYVPAKSWEAEGKEAGHGFGQAVPDPEASGGMAWESRVETKASLPALLFGPYIDLEPGDYVAFYRIKLLEEAGEETVAQVDACVSFARNMLRLLDIVGSDLALNRYVQVPLAFHYPGGKLECRVLWTGGYSAIRVDRISLFRLEGGKIDEAAWKAPQPVPSGLPKNLSLSSEPRPSPEIFPRSSPPVPELLVCDLGRQMPDWQLCLLSLQGIVNRTRPQVYYLFNTTDSDWLAWMRQKKWIRGIQTVSDPKELLNRFQDRLKGMIITDPKLPASKNVATMIAGVRDGVVVSPRIAQELSLPVLADLRGKWLTNVEAYRWAFDHLWKDLNHHVLACSYPDHLGLRDYLVQHKIFIFWLSGPIDGTKKYASPDAEVRLMEKLFARMPVNIPVMSYPWAGKEVGIGEGPGVTLFAEFGKYLVGSINCSNLSVHSGIRIQRFRQHIPPPPRLQQDKVYVSWVISDGDNLPVLTVNNFPQLWKDRLRGSFPIGWTISPSAYMLIPDIVDYYYSTATPEDCFLGAVSGIGYTYPDSYGERYRKPDRRRIFDGFLDQTRVFMDKMGLKSIWIMGISRPDLISRYAERIPSLESLFPDYGRRVSGYEEATYPTARNVPVFHALTGWQEGISREQQISSLVSQIHALTPSKRPAFMHLFVLNWFADLPMLQEILRRLGPGYAAVRPDHLAHLYRQEMARQQVLVRIPPALAAIEGKPIRFTAFLQDVSSRPLEVSPLITGGLRRPSLKPDRARLVPGQMTPLSISGIPSGDFIHLELQGPFGVRRNPIALHRISARELAAPLPKGQLRSIQFFEAETLAHRSGQVDPDASANGGQVWAAIRGRTEPGYIIYGPYAPLKAGRYVALFRLKRTGDGDGLVATTDTCVGGGTPVTASRPVRAEDLPLGQYRVFPLVFRHPGGAFETRVLWPGSASLAVDHISVWEIISRR